MIKTGFRLLLKALLGFVSLIILVVLLIIGVLFTNAGLNAILWGAQKALPQLEVSQAEGAIFPKFSLYDLSFVDDELDIDLHSRELTLAIDAECLLQPAICIREVKVDGLQFALTTLPPSEPGDSVDDSQPLPTISLPLPIYVDALQLTDIELAILGNKVDWQSFSSHMEMNGSKLTIYPTVFEKVNIELAASEVEPSKTPDGEFVEQKTDEVGADETKSPIQLPEVWIPLEIELQQFDLHNFTLHSDTPVIVNHLGVAANVQEYSVDIQHLVLDTPQADLDLKTSIELKEDYPLDLMAHALVKQTDIKGQKLKLEIHGSVAKLDIEAQLSALISMSLKGQLESLQPELPFDLTLSDGFVQWPLSGDADYTVVLDHIDMKGSLDGYKLDLATVVDGKAIPNLDLKVQGVGDLTQIELESILLKTLGGEVAGEIMANWQSPIHWQAALNLKDIQPGLEWEEAEGEISGILNTKGMLTEAGGWQVELPLLDIDGVIRDYPLNIEGSLFASDQEGKNEVKLITEGLTLRHSSNEIRIAGEVDKKWNLDTEIHIPALGETIPDVKGIVDGKIALRGAIKTPEIHTNLSANKLSYLELAAIENANLSGTLQPLPAPQGDIELKVNNINYENNLIDSVDVLFSGTQKKHTLSLKVLSEMLSTGVDISGGLQDIPNLAWLGKLEKADLSTIQGKWVLDHQVELGFDLSSQIAKVQAHCWAQADAKVCLNKDLIAGQSGDINLEVQAFDFEQIAMFIPQESEIDGTVDATAQASWAPNQKPSVDIIVKLPKGEFVQQLEAPVAVGWESMLLNARLRDDTLVADWLIDLSNNGDIKGNIKLKDVQSVQQNIDGQLVLEKINLDMIQPIIGEYSKVGADIQSNIRVTGPTKHPQINGSFVVDQIVVQGEISPIDVDSGKIEIDFSGYDALINADIETPDGVLSIDGDANWKELEAWSTNVRVFAEELDVDLPPIVEVKVKPDLNIALSPKLAKIEGDIYLPWGKITVEELPASAVSVSSDQVLLNENLQPEEVDTSLPMEVETHVNIHIGDEFELSAFGLDGELVGRLNVTQKDKGPFIVGEIEIVNGSYQSFGQDLLIDEGKVLMNGPADQPYLAIDAIRNPDNTQDDVVAGIRVTGPANEPTIEVYSDPSMPQQNALSYLLRGQDIDATSGDNGMTTALIGLSLAKSGHVVGQIGEVFGVSDLQLDTAGSGDESQVTVSGYITPELQVKYGVGIFDSFGEFTVRYKLLTDLYLEAVSGMDSAVDLLYQFEFD